MAGLKINGRSDRQGPDKLVRCLYPNFWVNGSEILLEGSWYMILSMEY